MATAILQHPTTESSLADKAPRTAGPLLVATDASEPSDAALRAARAISAHTGQKVRLIAVYPPLPLVVPEVQVAMCRGTHLEHRVTLKAQVKEQLERLGIQESWPLEVPAGDPAATIAAAAKNMGASMVIMGLGGHRIFHRIFGGEMVLKVLRLGTVPVLTVAPGFLGLPLHGLAAVDFSASGRRALALGGSLVQKNGRVTLAHVAGPNRDPVRRTVVDAAYAGSADRALSWMIAKTDVAETIRLERRVLSGDPADQLLQLADTLAPDLIIAGSHGHNFLTRLLIGSVSTRLLRESRRSILIVPPVEGPDFVEELPEERGRFAFYEWAERLEEFTRRNAGRLAVLEVIDPEMGAQVAEKDVPFVGASFAPRDARVHLMFGDGGTGGHRTRSIDGVTGIQMLRDRNGSDAFLRVAYGRGQTLVTLSR